MDNLQTQIDNLKTLQESYDAVAQAAEAYNTGKTELAANITAKGVEASATETLPELAEKVNAISQETYEINGGEMYAKQLFGSLETPNYWNLYDVLTQLLSDGRLVQYGGILLAEYYRGYDSLALAGAGAGGAYVVSDLDENGQFKMYTEDTTHVWATEFDGKGNRWVAYCFADEYHDFQITDTNTSPRSIFIGRKVGTITSLVNGRAGEIVVPDGNELNRILGNGYTQNYGKQIIIRNINYVGSKDFVLASNNELLYLECNEFIVDANKYAIVTGANTSAIIIKTNTFSSSEIGAIGSADNRRISLLYIETDSIHGYIMFGGHGGGGTILNELVLKAESITPGGYGSFIGKVRPIRIMFYYITNDKTKSVFLEGQNYNVLTATIDVVLQSGWCKPANLSKMPNLTKENVQAHIFDRLGVNDLSTGAVTITLANAVLDLFTQEEIDAVVARTNITIVGA